MADSQAQIGFILKAIKFAAEKHKFQRRKDQSASPYINHPIEVAEMLCNIAGVTDAETLAAAILHDTVEDTETKPEEISKVFGERVMKLVMECTDDKSLEKAERKRLQVEHASKKSTAAKLIKIADKTSNVKDVTISPPPNWTLERRNEYLDWSQRVMEGLRGVSKPLEELYDEHLKRGKEAIEQEARKKASSNC